ncbi:hypothetical protein B0I33_103357 [Prauserella shujinwangii]|uniref:Uncharacterized protein n=1 Tax=Prauserella shujinwangii TaxID=1453103 RepID=A0A2T0LZ38_9PSEU|nr:hypothetical protein B0I33_103357 [Prauserella shujinwangii]
MATTTACRAKEARRNARIEPGAGLREWTVRAYRSAARITGAPGGPRPHRRRTGHIGRLPCLRRVGGSAGSGEPGPRVTRSCRWKPHWAGRVPHRQAPVRGARCVRAGLGGRWWPGRRESAAPWRTNAGRHGESSVRCACHVRVHECRVGRATAALGHENAPLEHVTALLRHANAPLGHVTAPLKHANAPLGHANAALKHATAALRHANAPPKQATAALRHANAPPKHATAALRHANAPPKQATAALRHANAPPKHATAALRHANAPPKHATAALRHANAALGRLRIGSRSTPRGSGVQVRGSWRGSGSLVNTAPAGVVTVSRPVSGHNQWCQVGVCLVRWWRRQ